MKEHEFKVGDVVKIRKDSEYYGLDADCNPAEQVGEISSIQAGSSHSLTVEWGSGWNYYRPEDLEPVENVGAESAEAGIYLTKDSIREMRDRIYAIDAELKSLQEEREKLIEGLREEGLVLVQKCEKPELDMTDWRNWKVGDIVELFLDDLTTTGFYNISELEHTQYDGRLPIKLDNGKWVCIECVRWVSRPKA